MSTGSTPSPHRPVCICEFVPGDSSNCEVHTVPSGPAPDAPAVLALDERVARFRAPRTPSTMAEWRATMRELGSSDAEIDATAQSLGVSSDDAVIDPVRIALHEQATRARVQVPLTGPEAPRTPRRRFGRRGRGLGF